MFVPAGLDDPKATQLAVRTTGIRAETAVQSLTAFSRLFTGIEVEQTGLRSQNLSSYLFSFLTESYTLHIE